MSDTYSFLRSSPLEALRQLMVERRDAPRRFFLQRDHDVSGVSGTGHVADGVLWPDGTASVRWRGQHPSIVFWASWEAVEAIHGHQGATTLVWLD